MAEQKKPESIPAAAAKPADSQKVIVEVSQALAFDGIIVRPQIDSSGRLQGRKPIVKPVRAVIPRALAKAFGPNYVKEIGPAPDDAPLGVMKQ